MLPRTSQSNLRRHDRPEAAQPHSTKSRTKEQDPSKELAGAVIDYLKRPKEVIPPKPAETPPKKSPGMLFGEMVAEIFDEIPQGYERDMMKMEVLKVMYDAKYRGQQRSGGDYVTPLSVQTRPSYNSRVTPRAPKYQHHSPSPRYASPPSSYSPDSNFEFSSQQLNSPEYNPMLGSTGQFGSTGQQ